MRLLIIDSVGVCLDFALRCRDAGHEVKAFIRQTPKTEKIGRGLIDIVPEWQGWMRWADIVVQTDNTKYLRELGHWRAKGKPVIGATEESATWELDRNKGMAVFKRAGIATPPYREFSDYDAAIAYVRKEMRRFVSKPCGDEPDKSLSYVSQSPADMIYMLERWKKAQKLKGNFILQEAIDGCEMAVGGWFGPGGFNRGWLENWEYKRLMNRDLGVSTGEQGTVMRYVAKSKLAQKVLAPLARQLEAVGHTGYVDVNCIIDEKGTPHPLEFTMRFGWPTFNIQQPLHAGDPLEWLVDLAAGRDARNVVMDTVACGVVISIPDYPYSKLTGKDVVGVPIYGLTPGIMANVHPGDIMLGEAPRQVGDQIVTTPGWVTAGDYVMIVSGIGETVRTARDAAYRIAHRMKKGVPNSPMFRTDIGYRLRKDIECLAPHGYVPKLVF